MLHSTCKLKDKLYIYITNQMTDKNTTVIKSKAQAHSINTTVSIPVLKATLLHKIRFNL